MAVFEFIAEIRMHINADDAQEAEESVHAILSEVALDIISVYEA